MYTQEIKTSLIIQDSTAFISNDSLVKQASEKKRRKESKRFQKDKTIFLESLNKDDHRKFPAYLQF